MVISSFVTVFVTQFRISRPLLNASPFAAVLVSHTFVEHTRNQSTKHVTGVLLLLWVEGFSFFSSVKTDIYQRQQQKGVHSSGGRWTTRRVQVQWSGKISFGSICNLAPQDYAKQIPFRVRPERQNKRTLATFASHPRNYSTNDRNFFHISTTENR